MYDFLKVKNQELAQKVEKEAKEFIYHFHYGVQGIDKTEADVLAVANIMRETGLYPFAFDTEINFVPMLKNMFGEELRLHCAVSYPLGRMTLKQKLDELEKLDRIGVRDVCVVIDWQALFSGRYKDIENEATAIVKEFGSTFDKNAFVIPATLMGNSQIIDTCSALDVAGVESIKINPGAKLNVSPEEIQLINREFPYRFDLHPSGGIRNLCEVKRYQEMGCQIIHSATALAITDEYIVQQLKKYNAI